MMLGFAYEVSDDLKGPGFATRTYESVRRNRPHVIENLRQVHASNLALLKTAKCLVYVGVNKVNNKLYVGATSVGLEKRVRAHISSAKRDEGSGIFIRAIRKYGPDSFDFLLFAVFRDFDSALYGEQELIAAILPEYNSTAGGEGMTGWKPSEETLKRLSDSHLGKEGPWRGKKMPPELIAKRTATRRQRDGYAGARGQKRSPEVLEKIRLGKQNGKTPRPLSPAMIERRSIRFTEMNIARSRPVICVETGEVFPSIKIAAKHFGIATSHLGRVLHGESKSAHGLHFQFENKDSKSES